MNPLGGCGTIPPTSTPDASGTATHTMQVLQEQCGHAVIFSGTDSGGGCPTPGAVATAMDPYALLTAVAGNSYSSSTTGVIMGN